jgi:hypothetical protein
VIPLYFDEPTFHHHNERKEGLGRKTCSFKAQGVPGIFIFFLVFPYPAVPEVGTGKPALVGGFCPFVPGGLTISFATILPTFISLKMSFHIFA